MRIVLAPMEGVVDHTLRDMLTRQGGLDRCVTEFVRVTDRCLPARVFYRFCPELHHGGKTPSGVPVYIQLLGGQPEAMAQNALRAASLGAPGIDINFGCPAKCVNRRDGGSVLLKEPRRLYDIVSAVRAVVDPAIPVSAKIRLGFDDSSLFTEIVQAIVAAGANELTVHARTRQDGYKPPAYWHRIAPLQAQCPIPIIANGEIWSVTDARQCLAESGCEDLMLGRGLLTRPDLALLIKQSLLNNSAENTEAVDILGWQGVLDMLTDFCVVTEQMYEARYVGNRVKQWLGYLRGYYPDAAQLFEQIKRLHCPQEIAQMIERQRHTNMARTAA